MELVVGGEWSHNTISSECICDRVIKLIDAVLGKTVLRYVLLQQNAIVSACLLPLAYLHVTGAVEQITSHWATLTAIQHTTTHSSIESAQH